MILGPSISQGVSLYSFHCTRPRRFLASTQSLTLWLGYHCQPEYYALQGHDEWSLSLRGDSKKKYEIIKRAQFIYRNKDSDTFFLFLRVTYSNLLKEFEITNKEGAPDTPSLQFQMISKNKIQAAAVINILKNVFYKHHVAQASQYTCTY